MTRLDTIIDGRISARETEHAWYSASPTACLHRMVSGFARRVYHYLPAVRLPAVREFGELRPFKHWGAEGGFEEWFTTMFSGLINQGKISKRMAREIRSDLRDFYLEHYNYKPTIWCSTNPVFDPGANQYVHELEVELNLENLMNGTNEAGAARIEVRARLALMSWEEWVEASGISERGARYMRACYLGGGMDIVQNWRLSFEPIPERYWRGISIWNVEAKKWMPADPQG